MLLGCGHAYHMKCFRLLMESNHRRCPMCRARINLCPRRPIEADVSVDYDTDSGSIDSVDQALGPLEEAFGALEDFEHPLAYASSAALAARLFVVDTNYGVPSIIRGTRNRIYSNMRSRRSLLSEFSRVQI